MTTIANEIELDALIKPLPHSKPQPLVGSALPFLGAVKVRVAVRVGSAEISVADLLKLEQGAVVALDRPVDAPLDVLIEEHVVARGVLVAVGEHFGVRITETVAGALPVHA